MIRTCICHLHSAPIVQENRTRCPLGALIRGWCVFLFRRRWLVFLWRRAEHQRAVASLRRLFRCCEQQVIDEFVLVGHVVVVEFAPLEELE